MWRSAPQLIRVQEREKDVVMALITRKLRSRNYEIHWDPRRMNVALTRYRHGQFVLGHYTSISGINFSTVNLSSEKESGAVFGDSKKKSQLAWQDQDQSCVIKKFNDPF
ncbi:unnamed protein product [Cylicocyclus nassatus]|uniref:DNA2/NAM7 helicase-like C-terminal domain-containing protein n=1 Tax=Cylicocyclus nassatus TaxID=53992 RepID=A0AA36HFI1_CYLNA|nr:unnamed protein product [Cylicocyclus nassatus]